VCFLAWCLRGVCVCVCGAVWCVCVCGVYVCVCGVCVCVVWCVCVCVVLGVWCGCVGVCVCVCGVVWVMWCVWCGCVWCLYVCVVCVYARARAIFTSRAVKIANCEHIARSAVPSLGKICFYHHHGKMCIKLRWLERVVKRIVMSCKRAIVFS
jgi:hypothetical protein